MAHDEELARRVRKSLQPSNAHEIRMFGGLAFMAHGHMCCGVLRSALMARVGPDAYAAALLRPHVREMDFTGRPLAGYVFVDAPGVATEELLNGWVEECLRFVRSLPPKPAKVTPRRSRE